LNFIRDLQPRKKNCNKISKKLIKIESKKWVKMIIIDEIEVVEAV